MYFHRKKRYLRAEIAKKGSFSFAFPYKMCNFARQKQKDDEKTLYNSPLWCCSDDELYIRI